MFSNTHNDFINELLKKNNLDGLNIQEVLLIDLIEEIRKQCTLVTEISERRALVVELLHCNYLVRVTRLAQDQVIDNILKDY